MVTLHLGLQGCPNVQCPVHSKPAPTVQLLLDLDFPLPPLALDDFIVGENGALLHEIHLLLAGQRQENSLYFWSGAGGGKTHLLQASAAAALNHGLSAGYVDCAKQSLHQDLSDYAWLAIDNVETLDEDDQFQLFALFNHAREQGQRLIVAGSAPAKQLPLRADLTTRLSWGLTFELKGLNDDDKAEALCRHAQRRGFELPIEAARYLLIHLPRDMHSLSTALDTIDRASLIQHRTITLALVRQALANPI